MRRLVMCITISLLVLASPGYGQDAFVDPQGKTVPMVVAADRVAVVVPRTNHELAQSLAVQFGLQVTSEGQKDLFVFATAGPRTRSGLLDLAAQLRATQGVRQAGLVARKPGNPTPNLVSNQLVVKGTATPSALIAAFPGLRLLAPNPYVPGQFLVAGPERSDAFALSASIRATTGVQWALPNFVSMVFPHEYIPTDPLFANQWHHRNLGASGGTTTADARTTLAWDFTTGSSSTLLTIYELFGFDIAHEDLAANLWTNTGETAGNGIDDDGNGYIDDVNGWNFTPCSSSPGAGCGSNTMTPAADTDDDAHGTSVAGVAVAADNAAGGLGSCPGCKFQPTFTDPAGGDFYISIPFDYAAANGASIINCSWGGGGSWPVTQTAITNAASTGRGGLGTVVFFSAGNNPDDVCTGVDQSDFVSHPDVIGITSSSNLDKKVTGHGYGDCIGLMAPTRWGAQDPTPTGTLAVTTSDRTGATGFNTNNDQCTSFGLVENANTNYTDCFSGTSSASPLAAGVAGLMLSADSTLTRLQVKYALQDTADKIEDSSGDYDTASGFSAVNTHGYGRVNAFEAVRLVSPESDDGRANTDIFVRDNRLDWGNTDQDSNVLLEPTRGFLAHWKSEDIKVDAPPLEATAPATNADFEAFVHENAAAGALNRVYVRVRNRGHVTAGSVDVKLHWAFAGAGLPDLPSDFWTAWPADSADTTIWHPLGLETISNLEYSGASLATTPTDAAQIVAFDFTAPAIDPANPNPDHHCLLAVIDEPSQDRPDPLLSATTAGDFIPDDLTPRDNNVTHRNITVVDMGGASDYMNRIYIANPVSHPVSVILRGRAPSGWSVTIDGHPLNTPFMLAPKERRLVTVRIHRGGPQGAEVGVIQETMIQQGKKVTGGMTYHVKPRP
jgi:Subtilase family